MTTYVFNTKEQLIEALEAVIPSWEKIDADEERDHRAAEALWFKEAKAALREKAKGLAKATYAELKEAGGSTWRRGPSNNSYVNLRVELDAPFPNCPEPVAPRIRRIIAELRITKQRRFTVAPSGRSSHSHLHRFLSVDLPEIKNVCE